MRRAVKRSVDPDIKVQLVNIARGEAQSAPWKDERPLPLVIIDGDVVYRGDFSVREIVQEIARRYRA